MTKQPKTYAHFVEIARDEVCTFNRGSYIWFGFLVICFYPSAFGVGRWMWTAWGLLKANDRSSILGLIVSLAVVPPLFLAICLHLGRRLARRFDDMIRDVSDHDTP